MLQKLLIGSLVVLGIYLATKIFKKKSKTPRSIEDNFDVVFYNSNYKNTKNNWLAVSKMETAGWTSPLFLNGFNLWGMKKAKVRKNTQSTFTQAGTPGRDVSFFQKFFPNFDQLNKEGIFNFLTKPLPPSGNLTTVFTSDWAKYPSIEAAVIDILLWMDYTKFPKEKLTLLQHVQAMKDRGYFAGEDVATYFNKCAAWQNRTT
jgi:hypothetical protein